jgi:hypothetical protein
MQSRRRDYIEFCTAVVNQLLGTSALLKAEFDAAREIALLGRLGAVFIVQSTASSEPMKAPPTSPGSGEATPGGEYNPDQPTCGMIAAP